MLQERFGLPYVEAYGMTETASFLLSNPRQKPKRECLGIATFGVDARVVDPHRSPNCRRARSARSSSTVVR
jgi:fatty-acyl-CoA synthase/long-chain acyl-CoA synthetase